MNNNRDLSKRKHVLITGVSRGLGKELFELFVSKDHVVYGVVRKEEDAHRLRTQLPENGHVILADLSSDDAISTISAVVQQHPLDLLINNAGNPGSSHLIENTDTSEVIGLINVHCLGVHRTVKALKKNLLKSENPVVLNLNSRLGSINRQSEKIYHHLTVSYSYRIAKAAQNMLTACLRSEFNGAIKFISLHPGKMKTEIAQVDADLDPKEIAENILASFEMNRFREENGIIEFGKELIEW